MLRKFSSALVLAAAVTVPVWGVGCAPEATTPPADAPATDDTMDTMDPAVDAPATTDEQGSTIEGGAEIPE